MTVTTTKTEVINVPKLRFPEFGEEWKTLVIKDAFERIVSRNEADNQNVLTISAQYGLVGQKKFFSKIVASSDLANYYLLLKNDFAYNKSYSKDYPMGAVKRLVHSDRGVVSPLYICFRAIDGSAARFYEQYFESGMINSEISKIAQEGARNHGLLNMSVTDFFNMRIVAPNREEQQKVADFLTAVDDKVAALQQKVGLLKKYKEGAAQAIFTQKLHFKDENGNNYPDWEEKPLVEISERVTKRNKDNGISAVLTNSAVQGIVNQGAFFDKDIANPNNLTNYNVVSTDDFVYNPRISAMAPVGPIRRNHLGTGVMSPLYTVFRIKWGNLDFYESYFATHLWHDYLRSIANSGVRHDRMNITTSDFYEMPVPCPCEEEQQKIANFLGALDDKINLTEKELEQAKKFKKALLQQMFV